MADVCLLHHHRILTFYINCVRADYQFLFFVLYRCAVSQSVSFRHMSYFHRITGWISY